MQFKWILLFILGILLTLSSAARLQTNGGFNKQDIIKGNPRCPKGTRLVGNQCRRIN